MEDKESRTEEPTAKKRQKFRTEGKVANSKEIIGLAGLVASTAVLTVSFGWAGQGLMDVTRSILGKLEQMAQAGPAVWGGAVVAAGAMFLLPVAFAGVIGTLVSGFAQTKGLFTFNALKPKFQFLNVLQGMKKLFISKQTATNMLTSIGKVFVICGMTVEFFWGEMKVLVALSSKTPIQILSHLGLVLLELGARVVPLLLVFAIIDYILTFRRMEEDMKMTKQEVKDERKQQDGDPEVKKRIRSKQMEAMLSRMMNQVPQADVVVVNPTHYSVALKYDTSMMVAPRVIAKGENQMAARIREIARSHGVPVVHNPPLTRQLYAAVKVGMEVPAELYAVVAELLAYVFRLKRRVA